MPHKDPEARRNYAREYAKKWRAKNPERNKSNRKAQRDRDPEKARERVNVWRMNNPNYRERTANRIIISAKSRGCPIIDSVETVQWFLDNQKTCQICGRSDSGSSQAKRLVLDHDHKTGRVRGMLCTRCNTAASNAEHARKVLAYLEQHESGFADLLRKIG